MLIRVNQIFNWDVFLNYLNITIIYSLHKLQNPTQIIIIPNRVSIGWGGQYLPGYDLEAVWAKFSTFLPIEVFLSKEKVFCLCKLDFG
jgi:hypothetical protein